MRLVNNEGVEIKIGDSVTSFRGENAVVKGMTEPHKAGSTGRIYTDAGEYFPNVYGCKWVE